MGPRAGAAVLQGQQDVDVAQSLAAIAEADCRILNELEVEPLVRLELLAAALQAVAERQGAVVSAQGSQEDDQESEDRSSRPPTNFG